MTAATLQFIHRCAWWPVGSWRRFNRRKTPLFDRARAVVSYDRTMDRITKDFAS